MMERSKNRAPTQRTYKSGSISFNGGGIDCVIRNLSTTGACLDVESQVGIPENFTLVIKPDNLRHPCQVAWRKARQIGVRFV